MMTGTWVAAIAFGTMVFMDNVERLKLEPQLLSVNTLNPDRLATHADILASLGRT
ncbi:MAG TPA: hypothetical protein VKB50_09650 [Vicinamibacterales bacterium]|nr:hypothetical protein [Vicinamibacterales bacterium]